MLRQDATRFEEQASQFSQGTTADELFELKQTLDAYEVEEIDGHDLSRFLSTINLTQNAGVY